MKRERIVEIVQFVSVSLVWVFVASVSIWVIRLGIVSHELSDAFTASVSISLVALPIFVILAGVLTYTFLGLRRGRRR